jgi:hypothetical protein
MVGDKEFESPYAVADIHLGFKNSKMINLLKKRGAAISNYDFE